MDWKLFVRYGNTSFQLDAKIEYESSQIMRIRVFGKAGSILLENNYPIIQFANSKKGIQWKLREGSFSSNDQRKDAALLLDIMNELESNIKGRRGSYAGYLGAKD